MGFFISSMISRPMGGIWIDKFGKKSYDSIHNSLFQLLTTKNAVFSIWFGFALLIYGLTVGAFTVASNNFTADTAWKTWFSSSASFCIYNNCQRVITGCGIKLMDSYGFNVAVYCTRLCYMMFLVLLLSSVQVDKRAILTFT